ncbi:MAG: T9SS type A sorting domain-containing protein [Bacteroidota bacterium]
MKNLLTNLARRAASVIGRSAVLLLLLLTALSHYATASDGTKPKKQKNANSINSYPYISCKTPVISGSTIICDNVGTTTLNSGVYRRTVDTWQSDFTAIMAVDLDQYGNQYTGDIDANVVCKILPDGTRTVLAGSGEQGYEDGPALSAKFFNPTVVAPDPFGNFYIVDYANGYIRKLGTDGMVTTFLQLDYILDATCDDEGNLYVISSYPCYMHKYSPSGELLLEVGGNGFQRGMVNGSGDVVRFNVPWSICLDPQKNIYIIEKENHAVRKITQEGVVSTVAGTGTAGYRNGAAAQAQFDDPGGIASDAAGNLYVADTRNNLIRKINMSTGMISDYAGNGITDVNQVDGEAFTASFWWAVNLTIDPHGVMYIAESGGRDIRRVTESTILWSNGDTTTSSTVSAPGNYTVRAITNGCTTNISSPATVTIGSAPIPTVTASGSTTICSNGSVMLTSSAATGNRWSNGSSAKTITVSQAGTYTVKAISGTCTSASSIPVTVTKITPPVPTITSTGTICGGGTVTLTSSVDGNNLWSNGLTGNSITVSTANTYTVRQLISGCTGTASSPVIINETTPASAAGSISGSGTVTVGNSGNYSVPDISGAASYFWAYSGTGVSISGSGTTVSLTFASNATSGTLSVYGVSACGNGSASTKAINVAVPSITINSTQPISGTYDTIKVSGTPHITLSGPLTIQGSIVVPDGATFESNCFVVSGPGSFTVMPGGNLVVCNTDGIAQTGSTGAVQTAVRNFSAKGNYEYNGSQNQITGTGLPGTVNYLRINNDQKLTLTAPLSITTGIRFMEDGVFDLNNLKLTLLSSKAGSAKIGRVATGASMQNAGNFTVQTWLDSAEVRREPAGFGAYFWLGATTTGQTVNTWNTALNPYVASSYDGRANGSSVWIFSNTDNTYPANAGWIKPSGPTVPLAQGRGARIWFNNPFFPTGAVVSQSGTPIIGDFSLPVTYCPSNCAGSTAVNGWNVIANPYACDIDWNSSYWIKTNMANAIYYWKHKVNGYASYVNGIGVNGATNILKSGQGFMVKATAASPALVAREGIKYETDLSRIQATPSLIRLKLSSAEFTDETVIADMPGSHREYEPAFDASKFRNPAINIWTEPAPESKQAIASLPFEAGDTIALKLKNTTAGPVTLTATDLTDLYDRFSLYLRDEVTGEIMPISLNSNFSFNLIDGQEYPLSILIEPAAATPVVKKVKGFKMIVYPNPSNGIFTINLPGGKHVIQLFDNVGQAVLSSETSAETLKLNPQLPSGLYTIKATSAEGTYTSKIIVE